MLRAFTNCWIRAGKMRKIRVMSTICNPVKLTPPPAKKGRPSIDWQRCIICQVFTTERLCIPTNKGRSTCISAVNKRKYEVYRKLVDEYTTVENAPFGNAKYHKSCYKAFTSKQNLSTCSNFKSTRPTSVSCNQMLYVLNDTKHFRQSLQTSLWRSFHCLIFVPQHA
jgi:hypothetical protein